MNKLTSFALLIALLLAPPAVSHAAFNFNPQWSLTPEFRGGSGR